MDDDQMENTSKRSTLSVIIENDHMMVTGSDAAPHNCRKRMLPLLPTPTHTPISNVSTVALHNEAAL